MDDDRIVISSSAAISPEAVAGKGFTTVLRGYQPGEVRQFLKRVADEVAAANAREAELRRVLHDAQNRAAHPELDEAALTSSLGEHAGRLIASARETAAAITAEAERTAAATLRDAEYRIARIRQEADTLMARRVDEADGVSSSLRQSAEADARAIRDQAQAEAEAAIQAARSHGKEMVAEARAVRERMLGDLARRRRVAEVQLEQLRVARERLVQAYDVVRHTLEEVTAELAQAEPEARLAAEEVGRRMSDADAHPPLRIADPPSRMAPATGAGGPPPLPPPPPGLSSLRRPDPPDRGTELPGRPAGSAYGSEPLAPAHSPSAFQPSQPAPPSMPAPAAPVAERMGGEGPPVPPAWIERAGGGGAPSARSLPSSIPPPAGPVLVPAAGIGGGTQSEPVFDPADPGTWAGAGFGRPRDKPGAVRSPEPGLPPSGGTGPSAGADPSPLAGGGPRGASSETPPTVATDPSASGPTSGGAPGQGPSASARGGGVPPAPAAGGSPLAARAAAGSPPPPIYGGGNPPAVPPAPAAPTRPPLRPQTVADSVPYRSRAIPSSPLPAGGHGDPARTLAGGADAPAPGAAQSPVPQSAARATQSAGPPLAVGQSSGSQPVGQSAAAQSPGPQPADPRSAGPQSATGGPQSGGPPLAAGQSSGSQPAGQSGAVQSAVPQSATGGAQSAAAQSAAQSAAGPFPASAPFAATQSGGGLRPSSARTALDLRPVPPDLPRDVPAAPPDQPPELATAEQPAVRTPTGLAPVDKLFARLRHQAEAEPPAPAPAPEPIAPPPPADDVVEEAALTRRDQQLDPLDADLTRVLKRILQDEQNGVLERLREGGRAGASSILNAPDEQASGFTAAAAPALAAAYRAGGGDADDTTGFALGGRLATDLAGPLRERLDRVVATAGDDMEELAEAVRAAYRLAKLQEIEQLVRHHTAAAHALGAYAATAAGTMLRWVVDDEGPCPDCFDNTLAGPTAKGEAYPTGQDHPPAHRGCRCLLVAVAT